MATLTAVEAGPRFTRALSDTRGIDAPSVGVKASNLAELAGAGFPVPDGFVLTTAAFEQFLNANHLGPGSTPDVVATGPLPADIAAALNAAAERLGDEPLAVRSSGVAEDLAGASFAGQYESVLDVRGSEALAAAVRRCWASAFGERLAAYADGTAQGHSLRSMAVLVQRLVPAEAAGVAFTANPITGDRSETVVNAVKGLGERLVSGQAAADEWVVRGESAECRAAPEGAITEAQARAVADLAWRVEGFFGGAPQDIEWAITAEGEVFLLQARPMTALPEQVEWAAALPGVWLRNFRLGEWLGDPVTPLFETWLLTHIEDRLHANYERYIGIPSRRPLHVVVHGWYFYGGMNFLTGPAAMLGLLLRHVLPRLLTRPRRVAMMIPPLAHFGVDLFVREWRQVLLPRYVELATDGERRVEAASSCELVEIVDRLADAAGDYYTSVTAVAGFSAKAERPLAAFYRTHLQPRIGGSHLDS